MHHVAAPCGVGAVHCTKPQGVCVCFQKPHPGVGGGSLGGATHAGGPPGGLTPARFSSHGKHIVITFHLNVRVAQNCLNRCIFFYQSVGKILGLSRIGPARSLRPALSIPPRSV